MSEPTLCFETATRLVERMARREVSVREVMGIHLAQVARLNGAVNAICTLDADRAMAEAERKDRALADGAEPGPLFGLPVGIKDLMDTEGIRTTYGSPIYSGHVPSQDAAHVARLKAAGAIVLGKTNTPEFGAGSQTFNSVFGQTKNPYDLERTCGGSSGGAAVALACGMIPLADGSDLGGSLRNPASFCHVVGLRPSPGRVPQWPNADPWTRLSVTGPMGRSVEDVALLFSVMAGFDERDPLSLKDPVEPPHPRGGRAIGLDGVRIAWSPSLGESFPVERRVVDTIERFMSLVSERGADVSRDEPELAGASEVFEVLRAQSYVVSRGHDFEQHREQLKDTVVWNIEQGLKLTASQIAAAETKRAELFHRMREFLSKYDVLALPAAQVLPFSHEIDWVREIEGVQLDSYIDWMRCCSMITVTEHPALVIPCGVSDGGLPVGVQLVGRYRDEVSLLKLGVALQEIYPDSDRRPGLAMD